VLGLQARYGSSSFDHSGTPTAIERDLRTVRVAIGSHFHPLGWSGYTIQRASGRYRAAVYDGKTLECVALTSHLKYRVNDFAFHPNGYLMALATGSYDGGFFFHGDLLFWDLRRQEIAGAMTYPRQVVWCAFDDNGSSLTVGFRPATDEDDENAGSLILEGRVERTDWMPGERWLDPDAIPLSARRETGTSLDEAALTDELRSIAGGAGIPWELRLRTWGIAWDGNGLVTTGGVSRSNDGRRKAFGRHESKVISMGFS